MSKSSFLEEEKEVEKEKTFGLIELKGSEDFLYYFYKSPENAIITMIRAKYLFLHDAPILKLGHGDTPIFQSE